MFISLTLGPSDLLHGRTPVRVISLVQRTHSYPERFCYQRQEFYSSHRHNRRGTGTGPLWVGPGLNNVTVRISSVTGFEVPLISQSRNRRRKSEGGVRDLIGRPRREGTRVPVYSLRYLVGRPPGPLGSGPLPLLPSYLGPWTVLEDVADALDLHAVPRTIPVVTVGLGTPPSRRGGRLEGRPKTHGTRKESRTKRSVLRSSCKKTFRGDSSGKERESTGRVTAEPLFFVRVPTHRIGGLWREGMESTETSEILSPTSLRCSPSPTYRVPSPQLPIPTSRSLVWGVV